MNSIIWTIAGVSTAGVILRPFRWPEFIWAVAGAAALVLAGLLPPGDAWRGVVRGADVYLFLTGMMLLAEIARREGLFDWLAAHAAAHARGSARRLFTLIYLVGTAVTVFLSNDATAVVLTPAVAAVARAAKARTPLPFLLTCAFIANAASFVLPISNPANLVIYGRHMPPLLEWLPRFALPSALSIAATYAVLRWTQRDALRQPLAAVKQAPELTTGGRTAGAGLIAAAAALMIASAMDWQLGLPTFVAGVLTAGLVLAAARQSPWPVLRGISWGVLPLVAGLFILVEALDRTGMTGQLVRGLRGLEAWSQAGASWISASVVALVCNLMNNLPAGLIAGTAVQGAGLSPRTTASVLVGVDVGPNLSVTGSLATILWLTALRREGLPVRAWDFLKLGFLVMPPALVLALAALSFGPG